MLLNSQKYTHKKQINDGTWFTKENIKRYDQTLSPRSSICFIIYRFSLLPFSKLKNLWVLNKNGTYCTLFKINYGSFSPWYVTHGLILIKWIFTSSYILFRRFSQWFVYHWYEYKGWLYIWHYKITELRIPI